MNKLEQLYQTINSLRDLGFSINDEIREEADRLEEILIRGEIIPQLSVIIDPIITQIQCPVVLTMEYVPEQPLSIRLCCKDGNIHKQVTSEPVLMPFFRGNTSLAKKTGFSFKTIKKT